MNPSSTPPNPAKKWLRSLLVLVFWLGVWQLASQAVGKEYLLVSPIHAFARLLTLAGEAAFWRSVAATCLRVLEGFFIALVLGTALALSAARFSWVKALFSPLLRVIRATPVASFIILALVFLATDLLPVFIAILMVLPLTYSNLTEGIAALDQDLLEMARLFRFPARRVIRLIYLPGLMPYITAACTTGLGFAWKSVIAAEIICHPALSIGKQIHNARIYLEIADLFAWTAAVVLLSVLLERGAVALLKRFERRMLALSSEKGGRI